MNTFQAAVLGAVQGVTEFLPISSTAHLILIPWALGWPDPGLEFDVALHLGTLIALLIYFRVEWLGLIKDAFGYLQGRHKDPLVLYIIGASIPGAIVGLLFEKKADTSLRSPLIIATALIVLAIVLALAEIRGRRKKSLHEISWADALTVGCAQALAIIPGVSRSGVTITAGLFREMKRETAARFSFLLLTPITAGAVAKKTLDVIKAGGLPAGQGMPFAVGILVSAIVGFVAIHFLLRFLQTHRTFAFVYYRIALGIVVYLAFFMGFR